VEFSIAMCYYQKISALWRSTNFSILWISSVSFYLAVSVARPEVEIAHKHSNGFPPFRESRKAFLSLVCSGICMCTMLASWHLSFRQNLIKYTYEGNWKHLELKSYGDERFYEIKTSLSPKDTKRKIKFLERTRHSGFEKWKSHAT